VLTIRIDINGDIIAYGYQLTLAQVFIDLTPFFSSMSITAYSKKTFFPRRRKLAHSPRAPYDTQISLFPLSTVTMSVSNSTKHPKVQTPPQPPSLKPELGQVIRGDPKGHEPGVPIPSTTNRVTADRGGNKGVAQFTLLRIEKCGIVCRWGSDKAINSFIHRKTKNKDYKWIMDKDGKYSCMVYFSILYELIGVLEKNDIDASELRAVRIPENSKENERMVSGKYVSVVEQSPDGGLWCRWGYNQDIQTILGRYVKGMDFYWRKDDEGYICLLTKDILQGFINAADEADVDVSEMEKASGLRSTAFYVPDPPLPEPEYPLKENVEAHIPFKLREYQIEDAKKMLSLCRVLNANEMGCGKSIESVIVGESLPFPKLVICPATLRLNWRREIQLCNPSADIKILMSGDEYEIGNDWTIVSFSSLEKHKRELINSRFNAVFVDEAHYIKAVTPNGFPDSDRAAAALEICVRAKYVYPLTGTPKTGHNKDLFNIMRLIRHPLAQTRSHFEQFAEMFCDPREAPFGMTVNGNTNDRVLFRELKPYMIRHLKSEVMPDIAKVRSFIPVGVNLNAYNEIIADFLELRIQEGKTAALELVLIQKLKKTLASMKVDSSIELARGFIEQGEKVIIVTCYTEVIEKITKCFGNMAVKLVGGMSDDEKYQSIEQFQNGGIQVFAMNIVAGGVGITLTASHIMLFNDFDWVPVNLIQAEDRIARIGQNYVSNIFYMYVDGAEIDEYIASVLNDKLDSINKTVDGGRGEVIDIKDMVIDALRRTWRKPAIDVQDVV